MIRATLRGAVAVAVIATACSTKREERAESSPTAPDDRRFDQPEPIVTAPAAGPSAAELESQHHVVFADRISQAYLLLLSGDAPKQPTRAELVTLVRARLPAGKYEAELALLEKLIVTEPPAPGFADMPEEARDRLSKDDLLGLHIDLLPMAPAGEEPLVSPQVLTEPLFTGDLTEAERVLAPTRKHALLLRADYRNQFAVRGLRLLQTLVRVVAAEHSALIHDPDTNETTNVDGFSRTRLQASVSNIADQIAVVPFPDDTLGEGLVRLSTRGMRRFGSVDLELQGLSRDPAELERATLVLVGLAYKMVRMGEYDANGFAVEVDDVITLRRTDLAQAHAGRIATLPDCGGCKGETEIHLVEREAKITDPQEHVVAVVVAPRSVSDSPDYDHRRWTAGVLTDMLGN